MGGENGFQKGTERGRDQDGEVSGESRTTPIISTYTFGLTVEEVLRLTGLASKFPRFCSFSFLQRRIYNSPPNWISSYQLLSSNRRLRSGDQVPINRKSRNAHKLILSLRLTGWSTPLECTQETSRAITIDHPSQTAFVSISQAESVLYSLFSHEQLALFQGDRFVHSLCPRCAYQHDRLCSN